MSKPQKDEARISAAGDVIADRIHDVACWERPTIVTRNGLTNEVYRNDCGIGASALAQVLYVSLRPGAISAWHMHRA